MTAIWLKKRRWRELLREAALLRRQTRTCGRRRVSGHRSFAEFVDGRRGGLEPDVHARVSLSVCVGVASSGDAPAESVELDGFSYGHDAHARGGTCPLGSAGRRLRVALLRAAGAVRGVAEVTRLQFCVASSHPGETVGNLNM